MALCASERLGEDRSTGSTIKQSYVADRHGRVEVEADCNGEDVEEVEEGEIHEPFLRVDARMTGMVSLQFESEMAFLGTDLA